MRMADGPDGKIGHAELELGDSLIMLADEHPDVGAVGPRSVGGTPVSLHVYVEDADDVFERAVAAGATATRAVETQFYGDRLGASRGPVRAQVERRDPRRGRAAGGDGEARGRGREHRLTRPTRRTSPTPAGCAASAGSTIGCVATRGA